MEWSQVVRVVVIAIVEVNRDRPQASLELVELS